MPGSLSAAIAEYSLRRCHPPVDSPMTTTGDAFGRTSSPAFATGSVAIERKASAPLPFLLRGVQCERWESRGAVHRNSPVRMSDD
jgi:hypothetical protein